MARSHRRDDVTRIRKANASLFVEATAFQPRAAPLVDLTSLASLVEIAKKYETVILELPAADGADYLLWDDGLIFRFRTSSSAADPLEPAAGGVTAATALRRQTRPSPGSRRTPPAGS